MKINSLLAGTLAIVLVAGLVTPVFAGNSNGVLHPQCGDMYGSGGNNGPGPGSIFLVSQTDGSQTFIGNPTAATNGAVSGIAFDDQGRLWGSNVFGGNPGPSNLLQINPSDGSLINNVGTIKDVTGADVKVSDLAWDPVSKQLFGTEAFTQFASDLHTIDTVTGVATLVGTLPPTRAHISFAPDGTLFMIGRNVGESLYTIDPTNANVITQVPRSQSGLEFDALGVRADGTIFTAGTPNSGDGRDIWTIATDGTMTLIGNGDRSVTDLDFLPCPVVGGEFLSIDSTSLILAGAQSFSWMIPLILSGIGIGLFVVSRKSENS